VIILFGLVIVVVRSRTVIVIAILMSLGDRMKVLLWVLVWAKIWLGLLIPDWVLMGLLVAVSY